MEVKEVGSSALLILLAKSLKHWYDPRHREDVVHRREVPYASPDADRTYPP
jgi:hypothetical protein